MKPINELSDNRINKKFNPTLVIGELWYIRFEDNKQLVVMSIKDVTGHTVEIDCVYEDDVGREGRFMIYEINFVEKCTNKEHIDKYNAWNEK